MLNIRKLDVTYYSLNISSIPDRKRGLRPTERESGLIVGKLKAFLEYEVHLGCLIFYLKMSSFGRTFCYSKALNKITEEVFKWEIKKNKLRGP
jgi:hypothetical protein